MYSFFVGVRWKCTCMRCRLSWAFGDDLVVSRGYIALLAEMFSWVHFDCGF